MRNWKKTSQGSQTQLHSAMEPHEATLMRSLVQSLIDLLHDRAAQAPQDELATFTGLHTGNPQPPTDVTLGRLLPDFYRPEHDGQHNSLEKAADLNGALRSIYEPAIIDAKNTAALTLLNTLPENGGKIILGTAEAEAWLAAINDIRLALGAMLGINENTPDSLGAQHAMAAHMDVYQWLTVMQDSLVTTMMGTTT
ncbi:MAG: DUF2017 domain-containing protein [Mycobacteriaceae bacterium]